MNKGIGIVEEKSISLQGSLLLESGQTLNNIELVYETYGELNSDASNAILICHALSGNHHAAGVYQDEKERPGWWDALIGPGKAINTDKYFVVCPNNIGGCHGSTGPSSLNAETNEIYGPDFPVITVKDWVNSQAKLADQLNIKIWHAVIGGSLGGMQALKWSQMFPDRISKAGVIAAAPKLSAQNIAFNEVARQAIITDPDFQAGNYLKAGTSPKRGLRLARMVGHITYLSEEAMRTKFGRELKEGKLNFGFEVEFEVESYLRHQGDVFSESFDANTYLLMTKLLDYFDPADEFNGDLVKAFEPIKAKIMVISFTSDWRFSPERSKEIVNALLAAEKETTYLEIKSAHGHDSFLFAEERYAKGLSAFLDN
ncbi:MAG: homoserine O-acetyltransferase [Gammaproteobacteria bacterium]|jgi:homoserine O-acetyltransferase|nr:homoserine O-acetyltransferase [Gammaproteobacteria bacterium]HJL95797.1 homoserine O-acetyltransferase [SAR86 cluster bacterium]|tara:strand:- start:7716 stop:8828 length:1113 start_codon:yes stop_codon:yes gene_type:complete